MNATHRSRNHKHQPKKTPSSNRDDEKCLPWISTRPCCNPRRVVTRTAFKDNAKPKESCSTRGMRHRERGKKRSASQFDLDIIAEREEIVSRLEKGSV